MSNITHLFSLNIDATEHHLISTSPNLTITAQGTAGEAEAFMASRYGEYNHVAGFETGSDTIKVPLDVITALNASTALTAGELDASKLTSGTDQTAATADTLYYNTTTGVLYYSDGTDATALITLDGKPTLAASDIQIV